jgi:arsenate reductase
MVRILVLCGGNSCRSQMAEGFLRHFAGNKADIHSAGTVAHGLNPLAVKVMAEIGIDISQHRSKSVDVYAGQRFDWVITVCDTDTESCPVFWGEAKRLHHSFFDPATAEGTGDERLHKFREVRDDVKAFTKKFVEEHVHATTSES